MTCAPMNRRRALQALLATSCSTLAPMPFAQDGREVRVVLPEGTASGLGSVMVALQDALARVLGHAVAIDHQPGVGSIAGTSALVRSAPDGYTLGFVTNSHVITPGVYRNAPFDPVDDITPIAMIGNTPMVLVCHPAVPAGDANGMVALLKRKPRARPMSFGSSGHGSFGHLASERFLAQAGAKANHVAHGGVEPLLAGLVGGDVGFAVVALASVQLHLKSGALRALGVSTADRLAAAPDAPTMAEQGLPGALAEGWFAFVAPKGLPPADVERLQVAAQSAFAAPEVVEAMAEQGNTLRISTPQVAAEFIRTERVAYAQFVKRAGIALL